MQAKTHEIHETQKSIPVAEKVCIPNATNIEIYIIAENVIIDSSSSPENEIETEIQIEDENTCNGIFSDDLFKYLIIGFVTLLLSSFVFVVIDRERK